MNNNMIAITLGNVYLFKGKVVCLLQQCIEKIGSIPEDCIDFINNILKHESKDYEESIKRYLILEKFLKLCYSKGNYDNLHLIKNVLVI